MSCSSQTVFSTHFCPTSSAAAAAAAAAAAPIAAAAFVVAAAAALVGRGCHSTRGNEVLSVRGR